jgi:hypothetical protein
MRFLPVLPLLLCLWGGCSMLKPRYDPVGHQYAVTIKEDILDDTYIKEAKKLMKESFNLLVKIEESKKK